jgi:hypothetical protein
MGWKKCETCKKEFFQYSGDSWCPNCEDLIVSEICDCAADVISAKGFLMWEGVAYCKSCSKPEKSSSPYSRQTRTKSPGGLKSGLEEQAGDQARVVGKFGEVLQIIGYILIAVCSIGIIFSLVTDNWIQFIIFLLAIPTTFISCNVFGSALRAIALYIQVKVQ